MMESMVSVIIPTRNRADYLEKAVRSVQNQTRRVSEIIVIDDASSDETPRLLQELQLKDDRIKVFHHGVAKGGAVARNEGIRAAKGRWIAFLDDDDEWLPQKLETQLNLLQSDLEIIACSCAFSFTTPFGSQKTIVPPEEVTLQELFHGNSLGGASVCVSSAEKIREIGGFDEQLQSAQDWDLWIRLRQLGKIAGIKEVMVHYGAYLGDRITRNVMAKYNGYRRFYFKFRQLMDKETQKYNFSKICYARSRLTRLSIKYRIKYLWFSCKNVPLGMAINFVISSLPRIIADIFKTKTA